MVGCCHNECLTNFKIADMLQYIAKFGNLNEREKTEAIYQSLLESIIHDKQNSLQPKSIHTVSGLMFNFSWQGFSLCPRAFAALHAISYHKLTSVVESIALGCENQHITDSFKAYTENCNNEESEILKFLTYLSAMFGYSTADTDNIIWLRDISLKSDVYSMLCEDFQQQQKKPPTLPYFYSVWKKNARHIIPEGMTVVCSTCLKLRAEIASTDSEASSAAMERLTSHMAKQKALRDLYEQLRIQARANPNILVLIGDHMRSKFLPKLLRQTQQSLMAELFEFAVSGWYDCRTMHTYYYLFGEHFKESSDTIISCLHQYLAQYHIGQEHLYLIFDRHSTQANNLLMGYLEWLVRYKKMFKTITVLYLESGHTKTVLDAEHKNIAMVYYSNEIFSIQQYVELIAQKTTHHIACWFKQLYNFNTLFSKVLCPIPDLQSAHIFEITAQGTRTKIHPDEALSEWRKLTASPNAPAIEPFYFLSAEPTGTLTALHPRQPAWDSVKAKETKMLDLLEPYPVDKTSFLRQTLSGELGYDLNYSETWVAQIPQAIQATDLPEKSMNLEAEETDKIVDQEWTVTAVFDRKFAVNKDNTVVCMFQATYCLDDGSEVNEWQARENFTRETSTGRETNKAYETYEQAHKYTGKNQSQLRKFEMSKAILSAEQIQQFKLKYRTDIEGPANKRKRKHKDEDPKQVTAKKKQRK